MVDTLEHLPPAVRSLIRAARSAPSADNCQPCAYHWNGNELRIVHRGGGGFGPDAHATRLAVGAVVENVLQAADALGMSVSWQMGTERGVHGCFQIGAGDASRELGDTHPLFHRHTNRLPTYSDPLDKALMARLESTAEPEASVRILGEGRDLETAAEAVRLASAMRFRDQESHQMLAHSLRFSEAEVARGDGLDVSTLGLPPGGAALLRWLSPWPRMRRLNYLGAYRAFAHMESQRIRQAPVVALVLGNASAEDAVAAGQVMERLWIRACQEGLAVHPYYAVPDQLARIDSDAMPQSLRDVGQRLCHISNALLNGDDSMIHIMLRMGWPQSRPRQSRRLPYAKLLKA